MAAVYFISAQVRSDLLSIAMRIKMKWKLVSEFNYS